MESLRKAEEKGLQTDIANVRKRWEMRSFQAFNPESIGSNGKVLIKITQYRIYFRDLIKESLQR